MRSHPITFPLGEGLLPAPVGTQQCGSVLEPSRMSSPNDIRHA